jgi:predicted aldo/keto reductase-like oxidoreductase
VTEKYLGESTGKLGYGFRRLPTKEDGSFDQEPLIKMVDAFLAAGFTYFDTAYVYPGSEEALREVLVKRLPRDSFTIATKMPMFQVNSPEDMQATFDTSRARLGVDYIDFYLMHGLNRELCEKMEQIGGWDFVKKCKEDGKVKHYGFSFHSTPEDLDFILTRHPDAEFVLLQINYLDWDNEEVQSRRLYETARRHNKPILIMEPVKGGLLAGSGSRMQKLLRDANPDVSEASWAIRFAASLDGLIAVLSGMGNMEQLEDNIHTIQNLKPLTSAESAILREAVALINSIPQIPCTGCKYCVENCPQQINIPPLIRLYNEYLLYEQKNTSGFPYEMATEGGRTPSTCLACRVCETHCPQHIEISELMRKMADIF